MINFLIKKFVKNYEDVESASVRTGYSVFVGVIGIVCNSILFAVKFVIGTIIGSISVTADAFNNLSDAASSVIGLVGAKLASRPADKEHPFGHGRFEYISALIIAFLVLQVGFSCFKTSIQKVLHPEGVKFQLILVIILALSIVVKIFIGILNKTLGKRIQSSIMKATAADAFGDVLITSATIVAILIDKFTGFKVDGGMGFIVSIVVMIAGFQIAKDTLEPLIGEAVKPETYKKITGFVESYEEIMGTHDLIVHSYGPSNVMATIHAEVSNLSDIEEIHEVIDRIERDAKRQLGMFLVIHMDPIETKDEKIIGWREQTQKIVKELDETASIHDFRVVNGEEQINFIFDLVVDHNYTLQKKRELIDSVAKRVAEIDERFFCVITLEHGYVLE